MYTVIKNAGITASKLRANNDDASLYLYNKIAKSVNDRLDYIDKAEVDNTQYLRLTNTIRSFYPIIDCDTKDKSLLNQMRSIHGDKDNSFETNFMSIVKAPLDYKFSDFLESRSYISELTSFFNDLSNLVALMDLDSLDYLVFEVVDIDQRYLTLFNSSEYKIELLDVDPYLDSSQIKVGDMLNVLPFDLRSDAIPIVVGFDD